jgi:hypothetical protein
VKSLLGLGLLVMIVATAVSGVRLLWLARRTRAHPEFAMGSACLLLGVVGYPLSTAARRGASLGGLEPETLLRVGLAAQDLACFAIWVATWRIFRPERRWAAGLVAVATAALAASAAVGGDGGPFYWVGLTARAGAFAWTAVESGRYSALLARRVPLGLADPVVHDRMRLWAIATSCITVAFLVFGAAKATGVGAEALPVVAATSFAGLVAGVALWLAFVPPAAYARRLRARAG